MKASMQIKRALFSGTVAFSMVAVAIPCIAQEPSAAPVRPRGFAPPSPIPFSDHAGWTQMFDGESLDGWDGPKDIWSVEDGAIVGTYDGKRPRPTTYLIWNKGGQHSNFEMKLEIKIDGSGANGGVQIRSKISPPVPVDPQRLAAMTEQQKANAAAQADLQKEWAKWNMKGYQPDFDSNNRFTGNLYEQGTGRGEIAWRGQIVQANQGAKPGVVGVMESGDQLKGYIKANDWNEWHIIANGNTVTQMINGHVMSVFIDNDPTFAISGGLIGLEIEGGGAFKISHRNLYIKDLK